jgi:hypothetical protein
LSPDGVVRTDVPPAQLAVQPILLHTGNKITDVDRAQLRDAVTKAYVAKQGKANPTEAKAPAAKADAEAGPSQPQLWTLSPAQPFEGNKGSMLDMTFVQPRMEQLSAKMLLFDPGPASYLMLSIDAHADTTYVVTFHLLSNYAPNDRIEDAQFWITPGLVPVPASAGLIERSMAFPGPTNGADDAAYAFIAEGSGPLYFTLYSPNAVWNFLSCDIEATPMQ